MSNNGFSEELTVELLSSFLDSEHFCRTIRKLNLKDTAKFQSEQSVDLLTELLLRAKATLEDLDMILMVEDCELVANLFAHIGETIYFKIERLNLSHKPDWWIYQKPGATGLLAD